MASVLAAGLELEAFDKAKPTIVKSAAVMGDIGPEGGV